MSDERLRELQRRWQETGADGDEARFLLEQVRLGHLSRARLELASRLDHPAARLALGEGDPPAPGPLERLWRRTEQEVRGRLVGWPSGSAFELSEWVRRLETFGDDVVLEAGQQLARQLAGDWPRLQRALEVLRPAPSPAEPEEPPAVPAVECVQIVVETQDPELARERVRRGLVRWALGRPAPPAGEAEPAPDAAADEDPVSRLADVLLQQARGADRAGEVRLELDPSQERPRGVARILSGQGDEVRALHVPPRVLAVLIARFKYLAGLDLFETERPQAGALRDARYELRVETYGAEGHEACRVRLEPAG